MRIMRLTILGLAFAVVTVLMAGEAETRGLKRVVVKDRDGQEVGLYKGSYALLIGVSDYVAGWPDLLSIPEELQTVQDELEERGFVVRKILNPSAAALRQAFATFISDYGYEPDNRLLFYFAGHGYSRDGGTKGYLVPADAPVPGQSDRAFLRKALSMVQIITWAKELESKHAIFLFDSCFSGTIFKSRALPAYPPHISSITSRPVRQFITAGDAGETVPAKSVFTPTFVRALRGEADMSGDGYVTGTELGMYLRDRVIGYGTGQTPQFDKIRDPDLDEGDFVFVVRHASGSVPERRADETVEESNAKLARKLERERQKLELERAKLLAEADKLKDERSRLEEGRVLKAQALKIEDELAARALPSSTISGLRIEHDCFRDGRRGMLIHSKVTINNLKDQNAFVATYFYGQDGANLKDFNQSYQTVDGAVMVGASVVPMYEGSTWEDFVLFMPYSELHMASGSHDLDLNQAVWNLSVSPEVSLQKSDRLRFSYTEEGTRAWIKNLSVDYDVYEAGRKGMRVHAHLTVTGLKGFQSQVGLYFHDADGTTLKDTDDRYVSKAGQVSTQVTLTSNYEETEWNDLQIFMQVTLTSNYEETEWNDLQIFMPYQQLHRPVGQHSLKFNAYVWDQSGKKAATLTRSDWQTFDYRETGHWATLDDVRAEHNVYQDQKIGMRLHARVNIAGLKSQSAEVVAYFYFKDGRALKDVDGVFNTGDGDVALGERVTPGYPVTEWKDYQLFMPYDQLHLAKGKSNCKFYLTVWDHSSGSASKLVESDWVSFDFSK